ncbi:MAG: hypothetical protein AAGF11_18365 [Myxococcota bacterium]
MKTKCIILFGSLTTLTTLTTLTACGGLAPDGDISERSVSELDALEPEDNDDTMMTYYGDVITMEDIEDMEVHCTGDHAGNLKCFDTIAEADALFDTTINSLTTTNAQTSTAYCRFYEDHWFLGSSIQYARGFNIYWIGNTWNDRISSIECTNAKARVYEDVNFGGASANFYTTTYVGVAWNDQISSLQVQYP